MNKRARMSTLPELNVRLTTTCTCTSDSYKYSKFSWYTVNINSYCSPVHWCQWGWRVDMPLHPWRTGVSGIWRGWQYPCVGCQVVGIYRWRRREGRRRKTEKTGKVVTSAVGPKRKMVYSRRTHCWLLVYVQTKLITGYTIMVVLSFFQIVSSWRQKFYI